MGSPRLEEKDESIKIQYASKYAGIQNSHKNGREKCWA